MFNMELPEENSVFLFSRMLQLFPNLPQDVIRLYSLQYSNDAEMCTKMLSLLSNKSTQIDDLQVQNSTFDQSSGSDSKYIGKTTGSVKESNSFNQRTYELGKLHFYYPPVSTSTHNTAINGVGHLDCFKMTPVNENNNAQYGLLYNGNNILVNEDIVLFPKPTELQVQVSPDTSNVNNNSVYESEHFKNGSCILPVHQGPLPNELHIDIDSDKEFHSWRPNLSLSSLSSDFFLPQTDCAGNLYVNVPGCVQNKSDNFNASKTDDLKNDKTTYQKETLNNFEATSEKPFQQNQNFQPDIQGYLNLQKSHMSLLIYELMKTERELKEMREAVEKLTYERHLQSKSALDIENLNRESVQLRLECQCLCMEVDFFLKGQARLGEVEDSLCKDEMLSPADNLANKNVKHDSGNSEHDVESEDQEELKKWHCHQCTFANHPAIDACEICQAHRLRPQNCRFLSPGLTSCYCHPKEKSKVPLSS